MMLGLQCRGNRRSGANASRFLYCAYLTFMYINCNTESWGISKEDRETLLAGPDHDDYWEVWHSNPQVFGQCRNWLLENLPPQQAKEIWVASTTDAVEKAIKEKNSAAIASIEAAKLYNIKVLKRSIQDIAHNTTRFLVISTQDVPPTGDDRTSIIFSIKDKMGALHSMLTPFYKNKINLTKIESRPSKKKAWDYYFFVDFEGHRLDKNVRKALEQLEGMCKYLKVVGSYPV